MPISLVSIEDEKQEHRKPLSLVSIEDESPSAPKQKTPKYGEKPVTSTVSPSSAPSKQKEYLHPLHAQAELQKWGLSASLPAKRPDPPPVVDMRKTSFGVGLGSSAAGTIRALGALGAYAPADVGPASPYDPDRRHRQDSAYAKAERFAQVVGPSEAEVKEATKTLPGKVAMAAGYLAGEIPKYMGGVGVARAGLGAVFRPSSAIGKMATIGAADALGSAAVDIFNESGNLARGEDPKEALKRLTTNAGINFAQGGLGLFNPIIRGVGGAALGYAGAKATGASEDEALLQGVLQGGIGASPLGGEIDRVKVFRPTAEKVLEATGDAMRRRIAAADTPGLPQRKGGDPATQVLKAGEPDADPFSPKALAQELGINLRRMTEPDRQAFIDLATERITRGMGMNPASLTGEDRQTILSMLIDQGFPVNKSDFPAQAIEQPKGAERESLVDTEEVIPEPLVGTEEVVPESLVGSEEVVRQPEVTDPVTRQALDEELRSLQDRDRAETYITPDGKETTVGKQRDDLRRVLGYVPDNVVEFQKKDAIRRKEVEEREARIKAFQSGLMLNANPVGIIADYAFHVGDKLADKVAEKLLPVNDALRLLVGTKTREFLLDQFSAAYDFEKRFNISPEDSPYSRVYHNQNLEHRIERQLFSKNRDSAVGVVEAARKIGVLPQAKRIKEIDALLEQADLAEEARFELELERENLQTNSDAKAADKDDLREIRINEINKALADIGEEYQFPGGKTREDLVQERQALLDALTPEQREAVEEFGKRLTSYYHGLLDRMTEAGLVSQDVAADLKSKRREYIPFRRISALMERLPNMAEGQSAADVRSNALLRARGLEGSTDELMDPIEQMVNYTARALSMIDKNQLWMSVADLPNKYKNIPSNLIRRVADQNPAAFNPEIESKFYLLRNGKRETYVGPKDLVDGLKGASVEESDLIMQMFAYSADLLRSGATALYLPFIVANMVRDFGTAVTREGVWNPLVYVKALADIVQKNESFDRFIDAGTSMSGFVGQYRNLKNVRKQLESGPRTVGRFITDEESYTPNVESLQDLAKLWLDSLMSPFKVISDVAEIGDMVPRKAVFDTKLNRGASEAEAMMTARNVTVDFKKRGSGMRVLNRIVPFLNARIQGTENMRSTFMNDPVRAAARAIAIGALPAAAVAVWNMNEYEDVWKEISERDKQNYLIWVLGRARDPETGRYNQIARIPKPEILKPIMNFVQAYVEHVKWEQPKNWAKLVLNTISDAAPIGFMKDGEVAGEEMVTSIIPPVVRTVVDLAHNEKSYYGGPIVGRYNRNEMKASPTEQYDNRTPLPAVKAGQLLGMSPRQIEYGVEGTLAGLGRTMMQAGDMAMRLPILRRPTVEEAQDVQESGKRFLKNFVYPFAGAYPKYREEGEAQMEKQAETETADLKMQKMREAEELISKTKTLPESERLAAFKAAILAKEDPVERKRLNAELKRLYTMQRQRSADTKALSQWQDVKMMPPDEQVEAIRDLVLNQGLDEEAGKILMGLSKGEQFISEVDKSRNSRLDLETRARIVAYRIQAIRDMQTSDEKKREALRKELKWLRNSNLLTDRVEPLAKLFLKSLNSKKN